ncbi:MAG TPA: OsmC family protein [Stellaceae bacterium]|nr:OsmC family protein [Stellaceae bacterium]
MSSAHSSDARPLDPDWIEVEETKTGKFTNRLRDGRHELTADEPKAVGGDDRGPGPYELLLMALGACKSMTVRLYAERKGWPLQRTRVRLHHSRIHAQDCAECETKEGMLDRIDCVLEFEGALDAAQRQRLLEIAGMCPVHRTLTSEIQIRSSLSGTA